MKKLYTLALAALFSSFAFGQQRSINNSAERIVNPKLKAPAGTKFKGSPSADRAYSGWLNYALQLDDPNGVSPGSADPNFNLIFPDSSIIVGQYTDGSTAYPQFHKAGTMLDPKNMIVEGINATDAYTLDSLSIAYAYIRGASLPVGVIDTLTIDIIKHDPALLWTLSAGNATYQDIEYDQATNTIKASNVIATYKYYLDVNDTSSFVQEILLQTTGLPTIAAGNRIGVVVSYTPGYSYSITDSISDKGAFYIFSYEQNGLDTDPTFYGSIGDGTSDMNCSYELTTDSRYNQSSTGWDGYLIPTWAWQSGFSHEHHIISFKISTITGINENNLDLGLNLYPNPATENVQVNFELSAETAVAINVYDVAGKLIKTINNGSQAQGRHFATINTSELAKGFYTVSVQTAEGRSTAKLIVK